MKQDSKLDPLVTIKVKKSVARKLKIIAVNAGMTRQELLEDLSTAADKNKK